MKDKSKNRDSVKGEKRNIEDGEKVVKKKKFKKDKKSTKNVSTDEVENDNSDVPIIENSKEDVENEDKEEKEGEEGEEGEEEKEVIDKKKKPSKRQLKKEKAELRAAVAREANKQENAQKALNYVSKWKHAKSEWKFEKIKQIWLMDNLLNEKYVPDDHFPIIIEYFEGATDSTKKRLIDKAMNVVKKIEDAVEEGEELVETVEYKRARQLLQALPTET